MDNRIFKELFSTSPIASYICDQAGYIVAFNNTAATLWGRKPELGKEKWSGAYATYWPDGRPMDREVTPMALAVLKQETFNGEELIIERPDATRRNILVFPKAMRTDTGELIGGHNTLVDITTYKQFEEKQAILSEIVQSSEDAIISKNLDGIIMSWNSGAERIFGYGEEEIIGKSIYTLIPPYLKTEEESIIREIKEGRKVDHYQTIRVTKSGKEIPISLTVSPMRNKLGQIIGASKIARDISDKIRREQTIQFHAQKLETLHAIGKLISEQLETPSIIQTVIDSTTHLAAADVGHLFLSGV